ncbi:sigma-70 family RNA polymerase sigma factor [Limosilactobacillus gastricus]|uniref:sigma-70 family RNA polymerase sigma factor n=1 Tax=Limosilactobacillus gastricus TaxID=227942 RepID=UPI0002FA46D1|nr:sigma-70 family RNA polymerase sigma factor [Limosilactobacillus gastricus]
MEKEWYAFDREQALIDLVQQDQTEHLQELHDRYLPLIRRLWIEYHPAHMERQDWEQEAMIVLHHAVNTFDYQRQVHFSWYYKRLLTNRMFDLLRRLQAGRRIPVELEVEMTKEQEDFLTMPIVGSLQSDELINFHESLAAFDAIASVEESAYCKLTWAGFTCQEIAQMYGLTYQDVRRVLRRAKKKVKRCFE